MILIGILTETLEALRVREDLTPLLGKRGERRGERGLPGHTDLQDLFRFLASRHPAQRREAKGNAIGILRLTHPVTLGHAKERCDRIGTDRQTDLIEPSRGGALELIRERGGKLQTPGGRWHGAGKRFARRQGGGREALGFENLWAGQQSARIASKPLAEGFTRRQVTQGGPQFGEHRPGLGPARWRQLEDPVGPGEQAVHMHTAGLGAHGGWRQASQQGVLELARGVATGRQETRKGRMLLVGALAQAGGGR